MAETAGMTAGTHFFFLFSKDSGQRTVILHRIELSDRMDVCVCVGTSVFFGSVQINTVASSFFFFFWAGDINEVLLLLATTTKPPRALRIYFGWRRLLLKLARVFMTDATLRDSTQHPTRCAWRPPQPQKRWDSICIWALPPPPTKKGEIK